MKLYLDTSLGQEFVFKFIPTFIYKQTLGLIYKNKKIIEKILKENNLTLDKFLTIYKESFQIRKYGKYYILTIKLGNIDNIIRGIDYGTLINQPLHIFDKTLNYVSNNLYYLYEMWLNNIPI